MMFVFGSFYVNPNMRSEGNLPSAGQHSFLTTFTNILGGPEDKTVHAVVLHELVDWSQCANVLNHISHNGQRVKYDSGHSGHSGLLEPRSYFQENGTPYLSFGALLSQKVAHSFSTAAILTLVKHKI